MGMGLPSPLPHTASLLLLRSLSWSLKCTKWRPLWSPKRFKAGVPSAPPQRVMRAKAISPPHTASLLLLQSLSWRLKCTKWRPLWSPERFKAGVPSAPPQRVMRAKAISLGQGTHRRHRVNCKEHCGEGEHILLKMRFLKK